MLDQVCTVHPLWSARKSKITFSRLKENIVRWPLEPLLYNLKQSCVDRTSKTRLRYAEVPPLNTSNIIIIIINDIYPGSSTHSKVVFREVLHPFELE